MADSGILFPLILGVTMQQNCILANSSQCWLTPVGCEHVDDPLVRKVQEDGPVEADHYNEQQNGYNDLVHRLNGGHPFTDRQG